MVIAIVVLCTAATCAYSDNQPKDYEASTRILLGSGGNPLDQNGGYGDKRASPRRLLLSKGPGYCASGSCVVGNTSGNGVVLTAGKNDGYAYCASNGSCIADGYSTSTATCTAASCCSGQCSGPTGYCLCPP